VSGLSPDHGTSHAPWTAPRSMLLTPRAMKEQRSLADSPGGPPASRGPPIGCLVVRMAFGPASAVWKVAARLF
jgi:hypothetical protein